MHKKGKLILSALNIVLLALISICISQINSYSHILLTQQAAKSWGGESGERFAQVSCFLPINGYANIDQLRTFRAGLDEELVGAGLEKPEEAKLWSDAYSGMGIINVSGERGTAEATAIGIGGDFFLFHPYELISGSYIADDDLMQDRVVLDYDLAWELFGGYMLQGTTVTINGKPYYVAGVVHRETDKFSTRVFSDAEPLIFMSYSALSAIDDSVEISSYELTMANPITGFVSQIVTDKLANESSAAIVENSSRYAFSKISSLLKNFGDRSIVTNAVLYPYWENAARVSEVYIARIYIIIALLALFPLICLSWILIRFIKFLGMKLKWAKLRTQNAWDNRYATIAKYNKQRIMQKERAGCHLRKKAGRK